MLSLLLAAAVIPFFGLFATSTSGQSMTTITTVQIYTTTTSLPGTGGKFCFEYADLSFSAQKDQQISTTIQSTGQIDFYLLTDADYKAWVNAGAKCDLTGISNPLVKQEGITSYDLSISIPNDGVYWYFFISRSSDTGANISFSYPYPATVSLAVTGGGASLGGDTTLIVVAVAAVVAVGLAYFVGTRRGQPPAAAQSELKFCSNCGQKIPTNTKFCGSCGATQE